MLFSRRLITIVTLFVLHLFGGGIYLYYSFFRQANAKLIETIPTDVTFLFQINDNETFLKTVNNIHSYITPLFELDAYPGCQFFVDQLPGKYNQVVFTGHKYGELMSILFVCNINKQAFKPLLSKLQIDEKNCIIFERCKIYTYGTHLKRFVFTYYQGFFLASENIELLKKSITQLKNPKNLTTDKSFEDLFELIEKNQKQNWIILNNNRYFSHCKHFFNEETQSQLSEFFSHTPWCAYQTRFSGLEMFLSGYISVNHNFNSYFNQREQKYAYYSSLTNTTTSIDYEKDMMLKYAKNILPTKNGSEIVIHAAKPEYWNHFLSEAGMKMFPVAKMKMFAFSLDSLNSKMYTTNAVLKF
ncbi:MAG: hypothetical protein LBI45_05655 [Bacteroidales bacterium]|jgi:hypothetical protein|nr:hypothetical protein [Bacteroidales bacterium]